MNEEYDNPEDEKALMAQLGAIPPIEKHFETRITEAQVMSNIDQNKRVGVAPLINGDDIDLKTELSNKEIVAAARLKFISERYDMPAFGHFVDDFLRLRVSLARKGRREFIEGLHADEKRDQTIRDLTPLGALMQNLRGGGGGEHP